MNQQSITIQTQGRGTIDITTTINDALNADSITNGLCHLFCQHTSASLMFCENYDPTVRQDLEQFTARWVRDGPPDFKHTAEGPDDMSAHIRSIFSHTDVTVPISKGRLLLGTWQGIFLWEHRYQPHQRTVIMTVMT